MPKIKTKKKVKIEVQVIHYVVTESFYLYFDNPLTCYVEIDESDAKKVSKYFDIEIQKRNTL